VKVNVTVGERVALGVGGSVADGAGVVAVAQPVAPASRQSASASMMMW
jgi:hypothetical protein